MNNKKEFTFYIIPTAIILAALIIAFGVLYKHKFTAPAVPANENGVTGRPQINSPAPNFNLKTSRGADINLEDFQGQNVLLVFWSNQCDFCQQELEDLKKFTENNRGNIFVIAIDYMGNAASIKSYQEEKDINFTILIDKTGEIFKKYGIDGTPYHFLINTDGKIAAIWPNYANFTVLQELIKNLE